MKYVIIEKKGNEAPIIFPEFIQHVTFKHMNPISAGMCEVFVKDNQLIYHAWGKSISLNLMSRPEDKDIIKHAFEFEV